MPLIFNSEIANQKARLGIWEIQESVKSLLELVTLNEDEEIKFDKIKHDSRKKQWLTSRIILQEISGSNKLSITYKDDGRPILNDGLYHISISHTPQFVTVIMANSLRVGIDIERIHPRILKVAHKFISSTEEGFLKRHKDLEESLVLIWSSKEALFKLNGKTNMDFRKNISIEPFQMHNEGTIFGKILSDHNSQEYTLHYRMIQDHILVYTLASI